MLTDETSGPHATAPGTAVRTAAPARPPKETGKSSDPERLLPHPLDALSVRTLWSLLLRYGFEPRFAPKVARYTGISLMTHPFRAYDRATSWVWRRREEAVQPPVFLIGHWRSGTTHLHNLLTCDPQFGWLSMFHCMTPNSFLGAARLARYLLRHKLPSERPMDAVPLGLDAPQEEELFLSRISRWSFNHCWTFPKHARRIFDETVLFESDEPRAAELWKRDYLWMLRRLSIDQQGKPLVLKNPPNTARIRQLLELFPQARFIHIYRNPYVVFRSTVHLWKKLLDQWAVQSYDLREIEELILYGYRRMMERYFDDVALIPPGQFAEVRFEDLETDAEGQVRRLYKELSLDGLDRALPPMRRHLESQEHYRKNSYPFDRETIDRVERHWGLTIDRWGYQPPGTPTATERVGGPHWRSTNATARAENGRGEGAS